MSEIKSIEQNEYGVLLLWGIPDDAHDCDVMGCPTIGHIIGIVQGATDETRATLEAIPTATQRRIDEAVAAAYQDAARFADTMVTGCGVNSLLGPPKSKTEMAMCIAIGIRNRAEAVRIVARARTTPPADDQGGG